jgi:predicted phage tail protein
MADATKRSESLKTLDATAGGNANITDFSKTMSDFTQTSATKINSLSVTVNGQTAAITTNAQAVADINGNLNAMYSIKVGVDVNGVQYAAGMGLGVQNTPSGMQSQVIFLADRFAVMSQAGSAVTLPFVIQNGQTFINDAFFRDASIQFGKITDSLKSDNFVSGPGGTGWNLPKSGNAELNNVTVRGTVYATDGEFTGKINATSGSFKGTVQADAFVGDVANAQVFADTSQDSSSVSRTFTYTDSTNSNLDKHVTLMAVFRVTGSSGSATATFNIAGQTKSYSVLSTNTTTVCLMFSARVTSRVVNCSISLTAQVGVSSTVTIFSPTMLIARGGARSYRLTNPTHINMKPAPAGFCVWRKYDLHNWHHSH